MKKYALENKVMIKGLVYKIEFDFSDAGGPWKKWHNFYVDHEDTNKRYELQITQSADDEPSFHIAAYTVIKDCGYYEELERDWYDLDSYLKDTESTVEKIKSYLIKKSDELVKQ